MNDNITISLERDEVKTLIEALLYSSSPSINANWYFDDINKICKLACKIREQNPSILSENITFNAEWQYAFEENEYKKIDQIFCKKIVDIYPEIIENTFL